MPEGIPEKRVLCCVGDFRLHVVFATFTSAAQERPLCGPVQGVEFVSRFVRVDFIG